MSDLLTSLILDIVPADGVAIGNQRLLTEIRQRMPDVTEQNFLVTRDSLIAAGTLARGRGKGGSVRRVVTSDVGAIGNEPTATPDMVGDDDIAEEDDLDDNNEDGDEVDDFALTPTEQAAPSRRQTATGKVRRKSGTSGGETQVISYRHLDRRVNNPDVGMVHPDNDPDRPKTVWAYDPHIDPALQFDSTRSRMESLIDEALASGDPDRMRDALTELKRMQEPYLNWAGKAERTSFAVDTVSLHVHERVDPASVLAAVRKRLKGEKGTSERAFQGNLFEPPFEQLSLRQALDFYRHDKNWSNRLISGDSLLVMNSLIHKENTAGQVQMIYIDPPYGIKYGSNFQPFTNKRDVKDGADADLTQEPEMIKAFRDTWELGIHSYLTYLRDRLLLAKELLHESGSIFVQISDENLHHVRELMDEIFGPSNFISIISFTKAAGGLQASNRIGTILDYIVWYARDASRVKFRRLFQKKEDPISEGYSTILLPGGYFRTIKEIGGKGVTTDETDFCMSVLMTKPGPGSKFETNYCGKDYDSGSRWWGTTPDGLDRVKKSLRAIPTASSIRLAVKFSEFPYGGFQNLWDGMGGAANPVYVVQTNSVAIERCLLMTTDPGDLVLDPTCGSGTTAFVAEKWGRRWITCDTSRVAVTLAKQRLMTASFDYYALRYPHEGLKGGFVYKTVPHVTLKSIANNPEIDEIYVRLNPAIAAALSALNDALSTTADFTPTQGGRKGKKVRLNRGETLHDWEVPFDFPDGWSEAARESFDAFHKARQTMQRAMDQSIAAHAEMETLYDKPEPAPNKLRITGPFSVEAVPNPTVLALDDTIPADEADTAVARSGETSRQSLWRDELMKTGIRGKNGQMLRFAELETVPGLRHLHASGVVADTGERVVVSFGPEHAALEQRQVEMALTEAETLRPAPKFIIFCAFTFDPEAAKDIDEVKWSGVTLLKAQMNTDLLTEDLKRARSSNQSFWLMGQPDIDVRRRDDGLWEVEVNGFDYFDPRAGELISGGKGKIAMWSLDTDYDQRSLFPHQVFFPMADKKGGWNRLKKTIRAELDESLLDRFHGTVSLPFAAGDNKRVAVKIVDDRGIESLKIVALDD